MTKFIYFPIIKTRAAELNGFSTVNSDVRRDILPIFELTKTRLGHKKGQAIYPELNTQLTKILDVVGKAKFVLDITDDDSLQNPEIRDLLKPNNGYQNWRDFVMQPLIRSSVIPSLLIDTQYLDDTISEIESLSDQFPCIAVKIPFFKFKKPYKGVSRFKISNRDINRDINALIDFVEKYLSAHCTLLILIDLGYIPANANSYIYKDLIIKEFDKIKTKNRNIVALLSSFPSYVLELPNNEAERGSFECLENSFLQPFCKKKNILYGDYASIHPVKYPGGGGGWVPRIDFLSSDDKNFIYYRHKDSDGGYKQAAIDVMLDPTYSPLRGTMCFGDQEIKKAAEGSPTGRAPSFWIQIRMNLFINRKILSLKKEGAKSMEL